MGKLKEFYFNEIDTISRGQAIFEEFVSQLIQSSSDVQNCLSDIHESKGDISLTEEDLNDYSKELDLSEQLTEDICVRKFAKAVGQTLFDEYGQHNYEIFYEELNSFLKKVA